MSVSRFARTLMVAGLATLALTACETTSQSAQNAPPTFTPAPETMMPSLVPNPAPRFTAAVAPDGPTPVALGRQIRFQVMSSEAGYANIYLLSSSGQSVVLAENLPVQAGQASLVPDPASGTALTASLPLGTDRVILLVTKQPMPGIAATSGATLTQPQAVLLTHGALIETLNVKTASLPPGNWALSEGAVTIVAGSV